MECSDVERNRCGKGGRYSPDEKCTNRGRDYTAEHYRVKLDYFTNTLFLFRTPPPLNFGACRSVSLPFHRMFLVSESLLLYPYILACICMNVQIS